MDKERNAHQIVRKDGKGCFVESLNDAFSIGRCHLAFASYDLNRPAGERQTNLVQIYLDCGELLELCRKAESGELLLRLQDKKQKGVFHSKTDILPQFSLPSWNAEGVCFHLCDGEPVLPAQLVGIFLGLAHLPSTLVELLSRLKTHRVENDMVVDMSCILVGGHQALIPLKVLGKGNTDLMGCGKIQGVIGREGLNDVVVTPALCLMKTQLHRLKFLHNGLGQAVHPGD